MTADKLGGGRLPGTSLPDEPALLKRAAAGDAAAFRGLVERHIQAVVAIARRILGDEAEAEDVAQEVMLRMWNTGGSLDISEHGLKPWLRRVTTNLAIDRFRSRRRMHVTDDVPEVADEASQERQLVEDDLAGRVEAALSRLPERQRVALTLFHFEGLSQLDVAKALGVSDEAVESLLSRARRALRTALQNEWRDLLPEDGGR